MNQIYFFMCGLPRSGNTLLSSLLNQNPNIHVGPNSPVSYLTYQLRQVIPQREEILNYPKNKYLDMMVKSTMHNYYADVDKPYIIDRSGAWGSLQHIEIIKNYLNLDVKFICPVRNVVEILTSFIDMCNNNQHNFIDKNLSEITDANRCEFLMRKGSMIDVCLNSYSSCNNLEYKKYFHFIEYDDLIEKPLQTLESIYDFLNIPYFSHYFNDIEHYPGYDDSIYGMELHQIRNAISKCSKNPHDVLPLEIIEKYSNLEFWRFL
jgi:sulfotransferase